MERSAARKSFIGNVFYAAGEGDIIQLHAILKSEKVYLRHIPQINALQSGAKPETARPDTFDRIAIMYDEATKTYALLAKSATDSAVVS